MSQQSDLDMIQKGLQHFTADNPGPPAVSQFQLICWADMARQGARFQPVDFLHFVELPIPNPETMELGTTFWATMYGDDFEHLFMVVQKHKNADPVEGEVMLSCAIHGTGAHPNVVDRETIRGITPSAPKE